MAAFSNSSIQPKHAGAVVNNHAQIQKLLSEEVQLWWGFFFFLGAEGREDPNTTISGPSLTRQRNAISVPMLISPTLNAGLVAL